MRPAGGTVSFQTESYCGLGKLGLAPTTGAHKHHQPSSSAESSESPRTGLCCDHASTFNMPPDAAGMSMLAAPPAADPTTYVMAIKQGLSNLAPSQLAELQSMLRQQRLQRQQHDLPILPPQAAAPPAAVAAVQPLLAGQDFPAGATEAAANAVSIMRQVASAANALANSTFAHEEAARVAFLQAAAAHLLMQHQQQYGVPAPAPAPGTPEVPEQQQPQQQAAPREQQPQHPGVPARRAARNTVRRCRRHFDSLYDVLYEAPALQQQQQDTWQPMAAAEGCEMATAAPSSYGAAAQFAMAPALRAALQQQLQQLAEAEQQQGARRISGKAAAAGSQRKSARARKSAKRDWDATNNTSQQQQQQHVQDTDSGSRGSPSPASPHAAAAPARAGSADANNSSTNGLAGLAATADGAAAALQQPVVKRVRFALADDESMESEKDRSSSEDAEQARHVVVRRIGVRAQARKRMHKRSARRRRPQRAPLC